MRVIRTALALGALAVSVPLLAQDGRFGKDRSRVERNGDARGGRNDNRNDRRTAPRSEDRTAPRSEARTVPRGDTRVAPRADPRGWDRGVGRAEPRGNAPDVQHGSRDRRDESRVVVRPPVVIDRYDHRTTPRYDPRGSASAYRMPYRYGDRDFRQRDVLSITAWFRALPPARHSAYGYYGPNWGGVRHAFRPGLSLSMAVFMQLSVLPYELELELGELPWYLERRIYGNTVLVIDTRTRMIVDIFDIDY